MRGELTKEVNKIAKEKIGREISKTELRLIPYIHYQLINEGFVDQARISPIESGILIRWVDEGFITYEDRIVSTTKKFWDFMCEILFQSYAKRKDEKL